MAAPTREQRAAQRAAAEADDIVAQAQAPDPADLPRVSILERRLQDPFGVPAAPVRLKDKTMFPRWFNSSLFHDRFWTAQNMGWVGVKPKDVVDLKQIGGYGTSPDGYVVRGERGQEMLMCMPHEDFNRLKMAKTRKNLEMMRDTKGEQARALEAASERLGADVATQMESVQRRMTVTDNYERVERREGSELE